MRTPDGRYTCKAYGCRRLLPEGKWYCGSHRGMGKAAQDMRRKVLVQVRRRLQRRGGSSWSADGSYHG